MSPLLPSITIKFLILLTLNALFFSASNHAARILGVFLTTNPIRLRMYASIAKTLTRANHNVTVIAALPNPFPTETYMYSEVHPKLVQRLESEKNLLGYKLRLTPFNFADKRRLNDYINTFDVDGFDLIILGFHPRRLYYQLIGHYNCPMVLAYIRDTDYAVGPLVKGRTSRFNSMKTLFVNKVWYNLAEVWKNTTIPMTESSIKYRFNCSECLTFNEFLRNNSIVFDHKLFLHGPRLQTIEYVINLDGDIFEFIANATEGIIFISFDVNIVCKTLPLEKAKIMHEELSNMPFKVLWQWDGCPTPGEASNIFYRSQFPEHNVLLHSGVQLFITNRINIYDVRMHTVPILGITFFPQDETHMRAFVDQGFGLILNYAHVSRQSFTDAVYELMNNASYMRRLEKLNSNYSAHPLTIRKAVVASVNFILERTNLPEERSHLLKIEYIALYSFLTLILASVAHLTKEYFKKRRRRRTEINMADLPMPDLTRCADRIQRADIGDSPIEPPGDPLVRFERDTDFENLHEYSNRREYPPRY